MKPEPRKFPTIGIIGAGVAGLAAGCYARMNGYEATIFEAHQLPGGLCTSWKKGDDFTIDGCIEWLVGTGPDGFLHRGWLELGALQGRGIVNHEVFMTFEEGGKALHLYGNVDRLEKHLLGLSPADGKPIRRLTSAIRLFSGLGNGRGGLRVLLRAPAFLATALWALGTTSRRFALKFKDPFLRRALGMGLGMPDLPLLMFIMTLAWQNGQNAGYPLGGSLDFAKAIERRFLDLGGKMVYEAKVERILEGDGSVKGLELADGKIFFFDRVIAAGDGYATFERLLDGRHNDEALYRRFKELKPFASVVLVSYGVRRDMTREPQALQLALDPAVDLGGKPQDALYVHHYAFDPTLAPPGKTVVKATLQGDYDHWKALRADPGKYEAAKHELSRKVLALLEKRFPGITDEVEVVDVATPVTFERYTLNWRGSMEGWLPDLKSFLVPMPRTLKGLRNLYFAGQWVQPGGGLPTCLMTGKGIIRRICKEDGKRFVTALPPEAPPKGAEAPPPAAAGEPSLAEEIFSGRD